MQKKVVLVILRHEIGHRYWMEPHLWMRDLLLTKEEERAILSVLVFKLLSAIDFCPSREPRTRCLNLNLWLQ